MTTQSSATASGAAGGVLSGAYPNPAFATNGTTPILGVVSNVLAADVAMATANTYVDGPSVALTAGTWLLLGAVLVIDTVASGDPTAKLWDGTTVIASGMGVARTATRGTSIPISGVAVVAAPKTIKISAAANDINATLAAAAPVNGAGNNVSYLIALRIA